MSIHPMRAAIYCRVSTHDQQTLPMQLDLLREYAAHRGYQIVQEVAETGSGAKVRPLRETLLDDARRHKVDAILVWKLDRWGRSTADLVSTLGELHRRGIVFFSYTEAIDLSTPSGKLVAGVLAVIAEFERDLLRERVKAGIAAAKARGVHCGRRPTARAKGPLVRRIHAKMVRQGAVSISAIARRLDISRRSVLKAIAEADPS